jgi:hypothetical protein
MLAATRDPMHDRGTQAPAVSHGDYRGHAPIQAPRSTGVITALQMAGSVLAIPVALGSAYTVYQANFSPDLACQNLRAGIVAMIDKKVDAATRRMLVRRDVEAFEKSCGSFDPDAKAAFANLLAAPRAVVHVPVTPKADPAKAEAAKVDADKVDAQKAQKAEALKAEPAKTESKSEPVKTEPAKETTRKAEPRPAPVAKLSPVPAESDTAVSDARWLDAVRGALVTHADVAAAMPAPSAQALGKLVVPGQPAQKTAHQTPMPLPSWVAEEPVRRVPEVAPGAAPALPAATAVPVTAPVQANDPDRPVPPAAIPETDARNARATWVSKIPFVGQVLDK